MEKEIIRIATEAQLKIDDAFIKIGNDPKPGSNLDQAGLKDGKSIVEDYISHGEMGVAFDHLSYMIEESGIALSEVAKVEFEKLCRKIIPSSETNKTNNGVISHSIKA